MDERVLDIGDALDERKLGRFHALVFGLCLLTLFVDGLDYSSANVAAPAILRTLNAGTSSMGAVFSMGFVGILAGSIAFGWIGDKYGRKLGMVLAVLAYSLPALLTVFATSVDELVWYRAAAGLGIGGVIPNIVALLTETAPKRFRVTFVMAVFIGYSLGNAAISQAATILIPAYGWQAVFAVAGIAGLFVSAVLVVTLPESIPFLAATNPDSPKLRTLMMRAAPELAIGEGTRFTYRRPKRETQFSLTLLFDDYRRIATPIVWLAFFAESLTYMTLSAWVVVLLEKTGLQPAEASLAYSLGQLGAIAAIILVARLFDRFGPIASTLSAVMAVAAITAIGLPNLSALAIVIIAAFAVASASAVHQSLNGMVGGFYPTVIRGNGIGYATGMGRIGAIVGPASAGYLLEHLPAQTVLVFIAAPDLVVAAACIGLARYASAEWRLAIPASRAHS